MKYAVHYFLGLGAASVKTCVLMDKMLETKQFVHADWVGFRIPTVMSSVTGWIPMNITASALCRNSGRRAVKIIFTAL